MGAGYNAAIALPIPRFPPVTSTDLLTVSDAIGYPPVLVIPRAGRAELGQAVGLGGPSYLHVTDQSGNRVDNGAAFHPSGTDFKVLQDVKKHVYSGGHKGNLEDMNRFGKTYYNRGIIHGIRCSGR